MKCQALQRRLIQSIELGVEKKARIAELEGLRDELKAILARQPGAESALLISELQVHHLAAASAARGHGPQRKRSLLFGSGMHMTKNVQIVRGGSCHREYSCLQAQLRERQKQLKALTGELNMEQAAAEEHKDSVMHLQEELHNMKHLWLEAKKQAGLCTSASPAALLSAACLYPSLVLSGG